MPVDSVVVPSAMEATRVSPAALRLDGDARVDTFSVGEHLRLAARDESEAENAERLITSGAYLGDPVASLRLIEPRGEGYGFDSGTAYLPDPFGPDVPGAFETTLVFRLDGPDGGDVGLGFEIRDPGGETGDVGQLLVSLSTLGAPGDSVRVQLSTRAPTEGFEPIASAMLAPRDWRSHAHSLHLAYEPGDLRLSVDGEALLNAPVRLDRPTGPLYIAAFGGPPLLGVRLLDWHLDLR